MNKTSSSEQQGIPTERALRIVGVIAGSWALLVVVSATLAYLPGHPDFSILKTYLSDIGDTQGWPQILFNSGTLIAAPMRFLAMVLVALRLGQLGAGRAFATGVMLIGFTATAGTVLMTAVPFSVAPTVHKSGIALYFLGIVVMQSLIGIRECKLKGIPRILPVLSFGVVLVFFVFTVLIMLYEQGMVERETPVVWEWLAVLFSVVWVFAQSLGLGGRSPRAV